MSGYAVLRVVSSVRVAPSHRRSWQGRRTKTHPVRCVEDEDAARGVEGRRDMRETCESVH
jgi:hypothetical protein